MYMHQLLKESKKEAKKVLDQVLHENMTPVKTCHKNELQMYFI